MEVLLPPTSRGAGGFFSACIYQVVLEVLSHDDGRQVGSGGPRSFNKVPCWLIVWRKNRNAKVIGCAAMCLVHKGVLQEEEATKGTPNSMYRSSTEKSFLLLDLMLNPHANSNITRTQTCGGSHQ